MSSAARVNLRRAGAVGVTLATAATLTVTAAPARAETLSLTGLKYFNVEYRGNGHGHGMSQYGARGAAAVGKSYQQILAFYYPGTTLTTATKKMIRVKLSDTGRVSTTIAARSNTTVTGVTGYLPTTGIRKYRLVAGTGGTLTLQKLPAAPGSTWVTARAGLPNRAEFYRRGGPTRVDLTDRTTTDYAGHIRTVLLPGGGVFTVDRVNLDNYVAGVVPREMPASWAAAAVQAQAVAARTYGANAIASPASGEYDICDTTQCQVYGGKAHYDQYGNVLYTQYAPAATATSYQILTYKGAPAFTQFSASNGGWTVYGGQPYLPAQPDPYDTPQRSFDPYIGVTTKVSVSSLAGYFGLAKVTNIAITSRDGHGTWGGRVLAGSVTGTDSQGRTRTVAADGYDFAWAFGLGTTWFRVYAPTTT